MKKLREKYNNLQSTHSACLVRKYTMQVGFFVWILLLVQKSNHFNNSQIESIQKTRELSCESQSFMNRIKEINISTLLDTNWILSKNDSSDEKYIRHYDHNDYFWYESQNKGISKYRIHLNDEQINNINYEDFMELEENYRFSIVTQELWRGYLKVKFPNKEIEAKATINDIIPSQIQNLELMMHEEVVQWTKVIEDSYFNIIQRWKDQKFESIFQGEKYEKQIIVLSGSVIKLWKKNEMLSLDYQWHMITPPEYKEVYHNEKIIRSLYWELIKNLVYQKDENTWEISQELIVPWLNEELVYSMIYEESKFDPNAISHSNTRGLMMIILPTLWFMLNQNNDILTQNDIVPIHDKPFKYTYNKNQDIYEHSHSYTRPYHPETSIRAWVAYLRYLASFYKVKRSEDFSTSIIIASYNAWPWVILKALQTKIRNYEGTLQIPQNWEQLKSALQIISRNERQEELYKNLRIKSQQWELSQQDAYKFEELWAKVPYQKVKEIIWYHKKVIKHNIALNETTNKKEQI